MASIKTYSYAGKVEASVVFSLGRMNIRVNFSGGSFGNNGFHPATYTTSNTIVQTAIEKSADFQKGVIKLKQEFPIKEENNNASVANAVSVSAEPEKKSYPNVTTAQGAREVLKADFGGTQAELQTAAAIRVFAEKKGVVFPNWN